MNYLRRDIMSSIFEKTMNACLEGKREALNTSKKIVKEESKKKTRRSSNRRVNEAIAKRYLREEDLYDEDDLESEVMDDVIDDVVVVVDPELDSDDIEGIASEMQDIIDDTPEGETPTYDEYIGDYTYTCPVCGNTFFSETEMTEGDECPVCGSLPDAFVLVGEVQSADDFVDDEDDFEEDHDDLEPDVSEYDGLESRRSRNSNRRRVERNTRSKAKTRQASSVYSLDEDTFNPFLNKFIRENYKNAKSFNVVAARKSGNRLSLECRLTYKTGKSKKVTLTVENFKVAPRMTFSAREDGTFKSESMRHGKAPFVFKARMNKNIVTCEGLRYDFITKAKTEGKKLQVYGRLIKESR